MNKPDTEAQNLWLDAILAAEVLATDPSFIGGVRVRSLPGPVRETWLQLVQDLLPQNTPWRRIPAHVSESRLLGGLDLAATLKYGRPVAETGILQECDNGVSILAMAERANRSIVAHLCSALDQKSVTLEREGLRGQVKSSFGLIALDEGLDQEEYAAISLQDRLAISIDLHGISVNDLLESNLNASTISEARSNVSNLKVPDEVTRSLCVASDALGVESPRVMIMAHRVVRTIKLLLGDNSDWDNAIASAIRLVLLPRALRLPAMDQMEDNQPPEVDQVEQEQQTETLKDISGKVEPMQEHVLESVLANLPPDLLARLKVQSARTAQGRNSGKVGQIQKSFKRGRPMGTMPGDPRRGARLNLLSTLRAAVPWQKVRAEKNLSSSETAVKVKIQREDFRIVKFRQRADTVTIFVVDASGSAALHRLSEAKGAVELMLADCYVRRDQVALIAFRGESAELLLPPTRSLLRAKRELSALPGGGGTPLSSALELTTQMIDRSCRDGATVGYVILTDGRANISRDGTQGREQAIEEALEVAKSMRFLDARGLVIDTSQRANRNSEKLASTLDAVYLPLPHADAKSLSAAAQANLA